MPAPKKSAAATRKPASKTSKKVPSKKAISSKSSLKKTATKKTVSTKKPAPVKKKTPTKSIPTSPLPAKKTSSWQGIVAFILGLLSLALFVLGPVALIFAVLGFTLGLFSLKTRTKGLGIGGIITSLVGFMIALITTLAGAAFFTFFTNNYLTSTPTPLALIQSDESAQTTLAQLGTDYLTAAFGKNGQLSGDYIIDQQMVPDDVSDILHLTTKGGEYLIYTQDQSNLSDGVLIVSTELLMSEVATDFVPGSSGALVAQPSKELLASFQKIVTVLSGHLTGYTFAPVRDITFAQNDTDAAYLAGNDYIIRPDGYSEIEITATNILGNRALTIFAIYKNGQPVSAGIAPAIR